MHPSQDLGIVYPRHDYDLWLTCEDCGDVFVHAELCSLRHDASTGEYTLRYACERCGRAIRTCFWTPGMPLMISIAIAF